MFLAAPGDERAQVELTHNWDPEAYAGGRNFGHLAYEVDDIYATCRRLMDHGVTINRPPRDGRMAFVRSPDSISIELLQRGAALAPAEPWLSMPNTGGLVGAAGLLEHLRGVRRLDLDLGARGNVLAGDHLVVGLAGTDHRIDAGIRIDHHLEEGRALEADEFARRRAARRPSCRAAPRT